ncbi:MAG: substrate-binding domain-containing protein [Rhodospirillales bacterium]|nr:substrate-binding domain-containing protein [Rhodospirillales bacterium]
MKELAARLSLTEGTVSRALNDYSDISESTRNRVRAMARELGYRPSSLARRLAKGITETIGIVLPPGMAYLSEPFLVQFIEGISRVLAERDRDLLVSAPHSDETEVDAFARLVTAGKVDGFVVFRTLTEDPRIDFLHAKKIPFVAHGRTRDPNGYAWLDTDNVSAFRSAVDHLVELGHRRIGFLEASETLNFARLRKSGFLEGVEKHGVDSDPALIAESALTQESAFRAADRLLHLPSRPTAILCTTDLMAIGAARAVRERGLAIGSDVSVIGYDGLPIGEFFDPPLTTITQSIGDAGRRTAEMLLDLIDGADPQGMNELWPTHLIRRASDGPPTPVEGPLS